MNSNPSLQQQIEASPALLPVDMAEHLARRHKEGLGGFLPEGLRELPEGAQRIVDQLFGNEGGALMKSTLQMVPRELRRPTLITPGGRNNRGFVPTRDTGLLITGSDQVETEVPVKAGTLVGPRAALGLDPTATVRLAERDVPYAELRLPSEMGSTPEEHMRWLLAHGWIVAALRDNLARANTALEGRAPTGGSMRNIAFPAGMTRAETVLAGRQDVRLNPGSFMVARDHGVVGVREDENAPLAAEFGVKDKDLIGEASAFGFAPLGTIIPRDPLQVTVLLCEGLSLEARARLAGTVAVSLAEKYRVAEEYSGS